MPVEFRIVSGARAGQQETFEKSIIAIGRHPANDLRFDAERDTDVSSRHAEVRFTGGVATIRDVGSTNGTFVNGDLVAGEQTLADGDIISFGTEGPRVEFRTGAGVGAAAPVGAATSRPPRRDTTARIAEAVEAQTGKLRTMIGGLAGLVIVGVGIAYWAGNRGSAEAERRITALLHQNDSLARLMEQTVTQIKGRSAGVDSALIAAQRESEELRRRLQAASGGSAADVAALVQDIEASASRQRALVGAAQVDWEAVSARNAPAMAFIVVDLGDEGNASGTGFNVSPSGLIVTNRHVVRDSKGRPARRVVVRFENTVTPFKLVNVVKVSETDELAWLKLEDGGRYPTVQGVARNATLRPGAPVALIGYPLGTATAGMGGEGGDINRLRPLSSLTVGTASKILPDTLQLDVYAAQGSSGSPVFNAQGLVVGVLFGSPTESNGRIIYAVPASRLMAQMPPEGSPIAR